MEILGIELRVGDRIGPHRIAHVRGPLANGYMSYRLEGERRRRYIDRSAKIDIDR